MKWPKGQDEKPEPEWDEGDPDTKDDEMARPDAPEPEVEEWSP